MAISYLQDAPFLKKLDEQHVKTFYVKIMVLDRDENPLRSIEGRVSQGSINIDGSSSMRRTANLTFLAEDAENDLTDIDNLLAVNKKISIEVGFENHVDKEHYDEIIWFKQGIFIINQPNIAHSGSGVTITLSCKDKMCLLNGECGGGLPTSVTFSEYDQLDSQGNRTSIKQTLYDIIQTAVINYGGEDPARVFINDLDIELKQIVRWVKGEPLYFNSSTSEYTLNEDEVTESGEWQTYNYNESVGYVYTPFVYPCELVSNIGESVTSVLDKIIAVLGNYEYFYDVDGNFVFQEKRNYLNTSYDPTNAYRLDNGRKVEVKTKQANNLTIIDQTNYEVDFSSSNKSIYTFDEGSGLIVSYSNTPQYTNLKNDYHIWGKNSDGYAIHYHLVVKSKPTVLSTRPVVLLKDELDKFTGRIRLATSEEWAEGTSEDGQYIEEYTPSDWRAEIYLEGLEKNSVQQRPDVYEQELLDLFDAIYDFAEPNYQLTASGVPEIDENGNEIVESYGQFKADIVRRPNDLNYFIDYLEPMGRMFDCSVDSLGTKVMAYQKDKVNALYTMDVPDVLMIEKQPKDVEAIETRAHAISRCQIEGQPYSNVDANIYNNIAIGVSGYSAQEVARDLLYQHTSYAETISLQALPIYYLEPNCRITVRDQASGIYGDYVIKTISLPLDAKSNMTITATKCVDRI